MTLNEYQAEAEKTAIYPDMFRVIYPALGITGEAGEIWVCRLREWQQ